MIPDRRYQGKPLVRLLECYVLWAIDQLPETEGKALRKMTPKLQALYRTEGDWPQVVAAAVRLPPDLPERIRSLWTKNKEIAEQNGMMLAPQQFAAMFVDANLTT